MVNCPLCDEPMTIEQIVDNDPEQGHYWLCADCKATFDIDPRTWKLP